jgi:protein-disulfide isomerase
MKNPWVLIGIIVVVLFGGAFWLSSNAAERNNEGVEIMQHFKGAAEPTVTLVEYSDFQCPACQSFQPAINEMLERYGDRVRLEYKHFPLPFHQFAQPAAVAAEAAGQQGKFFEYHDLLFENQANWSNAAAPTALFVSYAEELELDIEQFRRHMNSSLLRDKVRDELAEGRERGVTGTPTFFLNGEVMQIQTFEDFINQIGAAAGDPALSGEASGDAPNSGGDVNFGF